MAVLKRLSYADRQLLEKQDAHFLPLAVTNDARSHYAHLRQMVRLLRNRQSASPCSDLVAHASSLYERTLVATNPNFSATIACRLGCTYCCAQPVSVTLPEAFVVANAIRARPDIVAAVLESARRMQDRDPRRGGPWTMCPLLTDKACSAYTARPFNCRSFISIDLNDCVKAFALFGANNVRAPVAAVQAASYCRLFLYAALKHCGKSYCGYELVAALAVILSEEDAEARWLSGKNIFAQLQPLSDNRAPDQDEAVTRMAMEVARTL